MRRNINFADIEIRILIFLYHRYFDETSRYSRASTIREALGKQYPRSAVLEQLDELVDSDQVDQSQTRRVIPQSNTSYASISREATYVWDAEDLYKISKTGIDRVNKLERETYEAAYAEIVRLNPGLDRFSENIDPWEPIPVERAGEELLEVEKTLTETVEAVRSDNGYSATFAEERKFVLEKLMGFAQRLKQDTQIAWMYVNEFAIKPLGLLIARFGNATVGLLAEATRKAIIDWLKSKGFAALADLIK